MSNMGFDYDEHEAYLHQQEQRKDHNERMQEGPIECEVCQEPASLSRPAKEVPGFEDLGDQQIKLCPDCYRETRPSTDPEASVENFKEHVIAFLSGMYRLRLSDGFMCPHAEGKYVLWSDIGDFIDSLRPEDKVPTPFHYPKNGICPICGEEVEIEGETRDGRLIGSCKDAFTVKQWLDEDFYHDDNNEGEQDDSD